MRNTSCKRERGEQKMQKKFIKNDDIIDPCQKKKKKRPGNLFKKFTITGRFYWQHESEERLTVMANFFLKMSKKFKEIQNRIPNECIVHVIGLPPPYWTKIFAIEPDFDLFLNQGSQYSNNFYISF